MATQGLAPELQTVAGETGSAPGWEMIRVPVDGSEAG